jgi:shikimate kinase
MKQNIIFIGFASCGKTAVGKLIAAELNYQFFDLDEEIEARYKLEVGVGLSCREVYGLEGQEYFVDLETKVLHSLFVMNSTVLSTGGGAPISEINRPTLKQLGNIIYLFARPEDLLLRMKAKGYPAYLQENPTIDNLNKHWNKRHPVYKALSDIIIDTTDKDIHSVTLEVLKYYE